jgi:excisionase family DNA binding protein
MPQIVVDIRYLHKAQFACSERDWFGVEMEKLFSVEEAAHRLGGVSKFTIQAWLSQGRMRRTKVGGRTMIRESELLRVIEDGGKSPRGPSASAVRRKQPKRQRQAGQDARMETAV